MKKEKTFKRSDIVDKVNDFLSSFEFKGDFSDGNHTFNELYDHRINLWISLCNVIESMDFLKERFGITKVWKSWKHSDGSSYDGWFLLGMETTKGQLTYHIQGITWSRAKVDELPLAPEYDGHTPKEALERLIAIFCQ